MQNGNVGRMNIHFNTYQGKKIFITGHTGFKGSWLLKIFSMLGAKTKGYSLAPEHRNNIFNLIDSEKTPAQPNHRGLRIWLYPKDHCLSCP